METESIKHKIVLLGDGAVGKTSLVRRFVVDQFNDQYIATIGAKVMKKDLHLSMGAKTFDMSLIIWDVLGQKGFHGVQTSAFEQSRGVVFVFDLTRPETAESIKKYWLPRLNEVVGTIPTIIFANKVDLIPNKAAAEHEAEKLAKTLNCGYFLTSAKTGENVEDGFGSFAKTLLEVGEEKAKAKVTAVVKSTGDIPGVADMIMTDFCKDFGGVEAGTPVLNEQFKRAGLDINKPTKEGLVKVVDLLANVERSFKSEEDVEKSKAKRLMWVETLD